MTTKNDITGDKLATKPANDAYRDNWERIFGTKFTNKEWDGIEQKLAESLKEEFAPDCKLGDEEETE